MIMDNPFSAIQFIAEKRISEAIESGEFENLPGKGKPLEFKDMSHVPPELRMAYKILENSGCLPQEIADRKEISSLVDLLDSCPDEREKLKHMRRLRVLLERRVAPGKKCCLNSMTIIIKKSSPGWKSMNDNANRGNNKYFHGQDLKSRAAAKLPRQS